MGKTALRLQDLNERQARALIEQRLDPLDANRWARQAQALADATRLTMLDLIRRRGRLCVSDLCVLTERGQSAISRHLAILREAGLIESQRFDLWVYSRLSPDGERLLAALIDQGEDQPQ
jgi:ArsR family transcriptional regulator, arsenate/arsenite/antimonite-responsive transcriptional repressor